MTKRHHLIIMAFVSVIPNKSQAGQVGAGPEQKNINIYLNTLLRFDPILHLAF